MEKVVVIDGKQVPFRCTGGFLIRYKQLTGEDPIKAIYTLGNVEQALGNRGKKASSHQDKLQDKLDKDPDFDVTVIYKLIWVLARTADPTVPDLLTWVESFNDFPVFVIFDEIKVLIVGAFRTTKTLPDHKKKQAPQTVK